MKTILLILADIFNPRGLEISRQRLREQEDRSSILRRFVELTSEYRVSTDQRDIQVYWYLVSINVLTSSREEAEQAMSQVVLGMDSDREGMIAEILEIVRQRNEEFLAHA